MKRFLIAAVAASALLGAGGAALAQGGINARQAQVEARLQQGVRSGGLTEAEARNMRAQLRVIVNLEAQYRRSGNSFTAAEQADLMRRYAVLDSRIYMNKNDSLYVRNWRNINLRQADLDRKINVGVRQGQLTRMEAARLRAEFQNIVRLEARYRASGWVFTVAERRDLDSRLDQLQRRIRIRRTN